MWSMLVVVESPGFDQAASLGESREDVIVQALVAELPIEALDERILRLLRTTPLSRDKSGSPSTSFEHNQGVKLRMPLTYDTQDRGNGVTSNVAIYV